MVQYIQVLELAASRGYLVSDYALNENGSTSLHPSENQQVIEMALMQKWLRDTHKLFIEVVLMQPNKYAFTVYDVDTTGIKAGYENYLDTYESALLNGLNAALQLL